MPSKTRALTVAQGRARNAGKQCSHPECFRVRSGISKWCEYHYRRTRTFGHPDGHHLYKKDYQFEKDEVQAFLKKHLEHPGVQAGLKWIHEWQHMVIAADPHEAKLQPEGIDCMNRLRVSGVEPLDILTVSAAVFLYARRCPNRLPDDRRLTVAISRCVYYMAPADKRQSWTSDALHSKRPSAGERDGIGGRIRDTLGVLLWNISEGIAGEYQAKAEVKASFSAPFSFTPGNLFNE